MSHVKRVGMKRIGVGCVSVVGLLVLICSGIALTPSWARRSLPWSATEIHEYYRDARFGSDFTRCLKARINKEDFDDYANRLGLTETYDRDRHADSEMHWNLCDEPWWDPPDTLDGVRFESANGQNFFAMAAWHEGYVFFVAYSW